MALLSIRQYAAHRGCNSRTVEVALQKGRIHRTETGLIDSELADREWVANTNPKRQEAGKRNGAISAAMTKMREERGIPRATDVEPLAATVPTADIDQYTKARAVRERYAAMILKDQYEERNGKLVNREEWESAAYAHAHILRQLLMAIPDRISAELAAEESAANCHRLLEQEIRAALEKVAAMKSVVGVTRNRGMQYGNVG